MRAMMPNALRIATVALAATVVFAPSLSAQSVVGAPPASENLSRLQSQVDELEGLLRQATAENERLSIELRRARNENARLKRDLQGDAAADGQQTAEASQGAPVVAPAPSVTVPIPPAPAARAPSFTPPPSAAGQLGTLSAQAAPGDAAAAFREARRLLDAMRWPEAETSLSAFLRAHPESPDAPEARYFLGRTQNVLGRHNDAAATFLDLLRKSPSSSRAADAWVHLGISLRRMGETTQACNTFRDLPTKYPAASTALKQLAVSEARAAQCPAR